MGLIIIAIVWVLAITLWYLVIKQRYGSRKLNLVPAKPQIDTATLIYIHRGLPCEICKSPSLQEYQSILRDQANQKRRLAQKKTVSGSQQSKAKATTAKVTDKVLDVPFLSPAILEHMQYNLAKSLFDPCPCGKCKDWGHHLINGKI